MDERKAESSNTRLFKYGTEKLLHKSQAQSQNEKTTATGTAQDLKSQIKRRGKPTQEALYDLHQEQLAKKQFKKQMKDKNEALMSQTAGFKNQNSETLLVNGFKKEFRAKLNRLLDIKLDIEEYKSKSLNKDLKEDTADNYTNNPQQPIMKILKHEQVLSQMTEMGFLKKEKDGALGQPG